MKFELSWAERQRKGEQEARLADQLPAEQDLGRLPTDKELAALQRTTVLYNLHETNPDNGLVRDKTDPDAPCSIAAVGLALATIPAVVQRGVLIRKFAAKAARRRLRSLVNLSQGPEPDTAGYKGFLDHFLDIDTGRRVWNCELSTLDSAFLFAVLLPAAPTSTATRRKRPKSVAWPTRSTGGRIGTGRAMAVRRSATAGSPRPASCRTATRGMTRDSCFIFLPRLADSPTAAGKSQRVCATYQWKEI